MEIELRLDDTEGEYTLLFEGPGDASLETLRKIKGVFLAELEMPVEKIALILQNTPAPVISSSEAASLEHPYRLLKEAGSKVLIVSSDGTPFNPDAGEDESDIVVFELGDALDLGEDEPLVSHQSPESKTYQISDDSNLSLDSLMAEAAAGISDVRSSEEATAEDGNAYNLEIDLGGETPQPQPIISEAMENSPSDCSQAQAPPSETDEYSLKLDDEEPNFSSKLEAKPVTELPTFTTSLELDSPDPSNAAHEAQKQKEETPPSLSLDDNPIEVESADVITEKPSPVKTSPTAPQPTATEAGTHETASATSAPKTAVKLEQKEEVKPASESSENKNQQNTGEATEINIVPIRATTRKKLPALVENLALIGLGSIVLFVINWFYFNAPPKVDPEEEKQAESRALLAAKKRDILLNRKQASQLQADQESNASAPPIIYAGEIQISGYALHLEVTLTNKVPSKATFTITGAEPPPLNNDQIARGEKRAPWIKRAESAPFEFIVASDGKIVGTAPTKIYVEYEGVSKRLIKNAFLEGEIVTDSDIWNLTLSVSSDEKSNEASPMWSISGEGQDVQFKFVQQIELKKHIEEAPVDSSAHEKGV